ncbi:hypothetical protein RB601_005995 [Gaeumannomyces tritici]
MLHTHQPMDLGTAKSRAIGAWDERPAPRNSLIPDDDEQDFLPRRRFDPRRSKLHHDVPLEELVQYDEQRQVARLAMRHPRTGAIEVDESTVVVAIDAACRDTGRSSARAAWAVCFGPASCRRNECGVLPLRAISSLLKSARPVPQTVPRAEIEALARALQAVANLTRGDFAVREVIVRSHSEFLVRAMSEWIEEWIENKGRRECGTRVPNFDALSDVSELVDDVEYGVGGGGGGDGNGESDEGSGGLEILFWHTHRDGTFSADWLVEYGFDEE